MDDFNMDQFVMDVCIAVAGKRNQLLSNDETIVVQDSLARLERYGCNLIIERAAQLKYDRLKENIDVFVDNCAANGIDLDVR